MNLVKYDGDFHTTIDTVTKFRVLIIYKPKEIKYKQMYMFIII